MLESNKPLYLLSKCSHAPAGRKGVRGGAHGQIGPGDMSNRQHHTSILIPIIVTAKPIGIYVGHHGAGTFVERK